MAQQRSNNFGISGTRNNSNAEFDTSDTGRNFAQDVGWEMEPRDGQTPRGGLGGEGALFVRLLKVLARCQKILLAGDPGGAHLGKFRLGAHASEERIQVHGGIGAVVSLNCPFQQMERSFSLATVRQVCRKEKI